MTPAELRPVDPAEVAEQALAVVRADRLCFLATSDDDQPRLRPISPVKTDGFTVYFVNLVSHNKTREIANNPKVEVCYLDEHHRQVRITGVAEVVKDTAILQEVLGEKTLLRAYLETIDRSQFVLYCVRPTLVRYMLAWTADYHRVPLATTDS
jgi:general stress protein 26